MPAPNQAFVEIGEAFGHEWIFLAILQLTVGISENTYLKEMQFKSFFL
jgi:hypothetical protein